MLGSFVIRVLGALTDEGGLALPPSPPAPYPVKLVSLADWSMKVAPRTRHGHAELSGCIIMQAKLYSEFGRRVKKHGGSSRYSMLKIWPYFFC